MTDDPKVVPFPKGSRGGSRSLDHPVYRRELPDVGGCTDGACIVAAADAADELARLREERDDARAQRDRLLAVVELLAARL